VPCVGRVGPYKDGEDGTSDVRLSLVPSFKVWSETVAGPVSSVDGRTVGNGWCSALVYGKVCHSVDCLTLLYP